MSSVVHVSLDSDGPPRAKRSPLSLLAGGDDPLAGLPPDLILRPGAAEQLLRTPWPARALITETCTKIREFFGESAQFALEDAVEAGAHMLYLVIGAELNAEEAGRALDRFLEEWWIDEVEPGQESVHIGLELL